MADLDVMFQVMPRRRVLTQRDAQRADVSSVVETCKIPEAPAKYLPGIGIDTCHGQRQDLQWCGHPTQKGYHAGPWSNIQRMDWQCKPDARGSTTDPVSKSRITYWQKNSTGFAPFPWLIKHAITLMNLFDLHADGLTPYQRLRGTNMHAPH